MKWLSLLSLQLLGCSAAGSMPSTGPGIVELMNVAGPGTGMVASARAQFPDSTVSDSGCMNPRVVGPCVIADCRDNAVATPVTHADLGPVQFGVMGTTLATLKFSQGDYASQTLTPPLWKAGNDVSFSVGGDTTHISAPAPVTLTSPDFSAGATADFSMDLPLVWRDGTAGATVILHLGKYATCELPSESGSGTIPSGAFAVLPSGATPVYGYTSRPLTGQVGDFPVTFRPTTDLYGGDGMELHGSLSSQ